MPRLECTIGASHYGFGSTVSCCEGLDATWTGFRQHGQWEVDSGEGHVVEDSGAGEVCRRRQWSSTVFGTSVERGDTGQGESEEWGESAEINSHVLHVVEGLF